jgi:hypothetical protein
LARGRLGDHLGVGDGGRLTRLTRDRYVPTGDVGFYGDHEGGQRVITRFVLVPGEDGAWIAAAGRHWNLDREDPR